LKGRVLVWPVLALLLAALGWQSLRLRDRMLASRLTNQVQSVSLAAASAGPEMIARVLPVELEALRRAAEADPVAVDVPLSRGSLFLLARLPEEAIVSYRRAAALEPHPEIYLHLGDALLAAGQVEEARRNYRIALRLNPWMRWSVPAGMP
jgi:tetratricopeptide (TPR) repeat protein